MAECCPIALFDILCFDKELTVFHFTLGQRFPWGWDDKYIFIGNTKGGIAAISTVTNRSVDTLGSPEMSAILRFFDKHPANVGMLAGASRGLVYLWTPS